MGCLGRLIIVDDLREKKSSNLQNILVILEQKEIDQEEIFFFYHNECRVVHGDWINRKPRFEIYNSEWGNVSKEQLQIQNYNISLTPVYWLNIDFTKD